MRCVSKFSVRIGEAFCKAFAFLHFLQLSRDALCIQFPWCCTVGGTMAVTMHLVTQCYKNRCGAEQQTHTYTQTINVRNYLLHFNEG